LITLNTSKFLHRLVGIAVIFIILHLLIQHFQLIFFEYPLEYRENTDLIRTYLLSTGKNIFAYENYPGSFSQYGFIYPWIGSKLFIYTGVHFYPLRIITALAILPILGLFLWQGLKDKLTPLDLLLICGITYASCLIHVGNMLAMPNTLGLLFFSLSVLLPPFQRFNKLSLIASCIFSGLGFFTKLYFGVGAFYILFYLLVNRRWEGFWFMSIVLSATVATSVILSNYFLPAFYETNIALNSRFAIWRPEYIWGQVKYFIKAFFGPIVLLSSCKWLCPQTKIVTVKNPYLVGFALSSILLIKMGATSGQFFLYFQQLLIPFLIPLSIQIIKGSNNKNIISILLVLNLLYLHHLSMNHNELEAIKLSFQDIEKKTDLLEPNAEIIYNAPMSYFAIKQNKIPNVPTEMVTDTLLFTKGELGARYQSQLNLTIENILARKYQEIFIDEWDGNKMKLLISIIDECYSKSESFVILTYAQNLKMNMWVPLSHCKNANASDIPHHRQ